MSVYLKIIQRAAKDVFIALLLGMQFYTYNFLIVDLQATDDQIHRFLQFTVLFLELKIGGIVLVGCALKIKSVLVVVYNF
jgi:hypothetical protein